MKPELADFTESLSLNLEVARSCFAAGDYADANAAADSVLSEHGLSDEHRIGALMMKACVYSQTGRDADCLEILRILGPQIDNAPAKQRAHFYGQRAYMNVKSGCVDAALVDYEAARFFAREAGDDLAEARIRNNLAKQYSNVGKFDEAITEVDAAIVCAKRLSDETLLGNFYDQKAQILSAHQHYAEALRFSERAISLLKDHPTLLEARATHGRALIALGASFLGEPETVEGFCVRRAAAKSIQVSLTPKLIQYALSRSNGHVLKAADLLHVRHSALIRAIEKHGLQRQPKRHRRKSLIKK